MTQPRDLKALMAALDRPVDVVEVREIAMSVCMREMSVRERRAFTSSLFGEDGLRKASPQEWAIALVAATLCDAAGNRIVDGDARDQLWEMSEIKLAALGREAERINGLGKSAVEEREKN